MNLEKATLIDQNIINYAKLQMQAFQMLLNSGNILKARSDVTEDAINILTTNPVFSSLERNKLKTFYETAKKMYMNEDLFLYYQDIASRKVSDFSRMQTLRPKKQIISWFSRFTQNQKPLPVYKLQPNDVNADILAEDTPEKRRQIVSSIMNGAPISISSFQESVAVMSEDSTLDLFEVAKTPNGCEIRDEIRNAAMNFETNINGMDTSETNYTQTSGKAEIPMYFVVLIGAERAIHIMLYIMCNNQVYTIGLGYLGEDDKTSYKLLNKFFKSTMIATSTLYSPDYLLEIDDERDNAIIDIGILTPVHINKLDSYLNTIKNIQVEYFYQENTEEVTLKTTYLMGMPQKYSLLSNDVIVANYINCTSFIVDIFPHISCKMMTRAVVSPGWCKTNPALTNADIENIYELYLSNASESTQELITYLQKRKRQIEYCMNNQCVVSGGKKGRSRSSRTRSRGRGRGRTRGRARKMSGRRTRNKHRH